MSDFDLGFDTEINPALIGSRDPISQAISTLFGGAVASLVDAGASIWNTLPGDEVDTEDILARIGGDPLRVYQEHTDAVQLASLVGGSLLPGGAALKGMNLLRAGAKAPKWFSAAGKTARRDEMVSLFNQGKAGTREYKNMIWRERGLSAANNVADAGAAEIFMLGSMAAHPLLEDYWEDPAKNFGMSLALGGGLGAIGGMIVDNHALRTATGAIERNVLQTVYDAIRPVGPGMTGTTEIQTNALSIQNLNRILEDGKLANKIPENDLLMKVADKFRKELEVSNGAKLDSMLDTTLRELPQVDRNFILNELQNNPAMHGVNSVRVMDSKELLDRYAQKSNLTDDPVLTSGGTIQLFRGSQGQTTTTGDALFMTADKKVAEMYAGASGTVQEGHYKFKNLLEAPNWGEAKKKLSLPVSATMDDLIVAARAKGHDGLTFNTTNGKEYVVLNKNHKPVPYQAPTQTEAAYFPELKKFGSVKDVQHHAGAAALGLSEDALVKQKTASMSKVPNFDSPFEHMAKTTPAIDGDYAAWTIKFGKMDDDTFLKHLETSLLSADDLPQLQAIATKMASSVKLSSAAKVKIADRLEEAAAIVGKQQRTLGGTPVKYQKAFERIANNATVDAKFDIRKTRPGTPEAAALDDWIGGNTFPLHKSATAYFSRGYAKQSQNAADKLDAETVRKIYESAESQQLRKELASIADADGMIYAYRGVKTSRIAGQSPLESFAVTVDKTRQFTGKGSAGRTMLYKIDVEDVVAAVHDIGPKGDNVELIVRPTARQAEASLDTAGRIEFRKELEKNLAQKAPVALEAKLGDIYEMLKDGKFSLIHEMLKKGYSMDVIAKRVNMSPTAIEQFVASDRSRDAMDLLDVVGYKTVEMAQDALSVRNRPLIMKGSALKADYTKGHANLNTRQLQQMNQLLTGTILAKSTSPAAQQLHRLLFQEYDGALSVLRSKLGIISNELAGNSFLNSADHMMRRMEDVGPIVSVIGKNITEISNQTEARMIRPLSDILVNVGNDPVALTELNVGYQLYNRLQGRRFYENRQWWQLVPEIAADGKEVMVKKAVTFDGKEYKVVSDSVDQFFTKAVQAGRELRAMHETADSIMGVTSRSDIGDWLPAMNPANKHIAYLHDRATDTTRMIYGRTPEDLESGIAAFTEEIIKSKGNLMVVRKGDQTWWNYTNGRSGSIHMQAVDASKLKTGAGASAIVPTSREVLSELIGGYQHYINANVRRLAELSMSDIADTLRMYSKHNTAGFEAQPLGFLQRVQSKPKDVGADTLNILMGNPLLKEYEGWKTLSQGFEAALTKGLTVSQDAWRTLKRGLPKFGKSMTADDMAKFDYEAYEKKLADAGVLNPFADLDRAVAEQMFQRSQLSDVPDIAKRVIAASNGLVSTMALRFGELAHPLVNLMSMPIMTALANSRNMPERFMGVQRATREVSTTQVMYEGIRSMNSPRFAVLNKKWEDLGYFKPLVSEATEAMQDARKFEKGAIAATERAINSGFVNVMSKPADYSEALSRKIMMHTGYQLGKRLYPELTDEGLTIFARDFMDKALGNYSAAQRPVMFQGTLGMAMGLFQTYMLTLAQNVYRNVELKDWKTLAKGMLTQRNIFGFGSMPGFEPVSKMIGEHFSEEHFDLTTGTYRAVGEKADWILHGLPSNLLQTSLYTRGNIDPRFPNVAGGLDNLAAYSMLAQAGQFVGNAARALGQGEDAGQAMLQAFSLQSLSRPIARGAEIGMALTGEGGSLNQAGKTVQVSDEVLTTNGIFSRVLASRPLEEAKLRDMQRMNRFYEAADKDRRERTINKLRTAFRNGTNTPAKIEEIAEEYMRNGGSPVGWRTAYRTAQAKTLTPGMDTFIEDIDETNPLNHMIDSLD